jgi:hypothetical protein
MRGGKDDLRDGGVGGGDLRGGGLRDDGLRDDDLRDDDLRMRFAALRREEEMLAPAFELPRGDLAARGWRWSAGTLMAAAVCAITITVAVVLLRLVPAAPRGSNSSPVASLSQWRSPTDFLLETPGREMLRSVPAIGVWQEPGKVSRPGKKRSQIRKRALP